MRVLGAILALVLLASPAAALDLRQGDVVAVDRDGDVLRIRTRGPSWDPRRRTTLRWFQSPVDDCCVFAGLLPGRKLLVLAGAYDLWRVSLGSGRATRLAAGGPFESVTSSVALPHGGLLLAGRLRQQEGDGVFRFDPQLGSVERVGTALESPGTLVLEDEGRVLLSAVVFVPNGGVGEEQPVLLRLDLATGASEELLRIPEDAARLSAAFRMGGHPERFDFGHVYATLVRDYGSSTQSVSVVHIDPDDPPAWNELVRLAGQGMGSRPWCDAIVARDGDSMLAACGDVIFEIPIESPRFTLPYLGVPAAAFRDLLVLPEKSR